VLLIVGVVASLVWLDRWTVSPAPPIAPAPATSAPPQTPARWYPFDPTGDPDLHPRGKPVLIAERTFAGRPYRIWAFQATLARKRGLQICVALQEPGGAGGTGCEPVAWPAGIGATAIGDRVQLLDGHVSKRAQLVRLELARAGVPLPPLVVRPLSGGPHLPVNIWVATTGRTVDVRRVVLLDAAGREIGSGRGFPASSDLLPPAGPVTVLGHPPSATGRCGSRPTMLRRRSPASRSSSTSARATASSSVPRRPRPAGQCWRPMGSAAEGPRSCMGPHRGRPGGCGSR
jgi:hypothetical protein